VDINSEPKLIHGGVAIDDRGELRFINDFGFEGVKRFYTVENHCSHFVRAWHGHKKEGKYALVTFGAAIVAIAPLQAFEDYDAGKSDRYTYDQVQRFVLSSTKPAILWIPPGYANGTKNLTEDTQIMFFSTTTMEESAGDDYRYPASYFEQVWEIEER
jgi:dTDP-4-dehydrorhamnose 3,5-epimerase